MKKISIFFSFDDNYVVPAAVAFFTLLEKAKDDVFYDMYVIHHDIQCKNQELLNNIVSNKGNACIKFINSGDFLYGEWGQSFTSGKTYNSINQFTLDTLIRCFAARFFPSLDKIIYSDVDVIFMDDISELWDIDISNVYIAAVRNAFLKFSKDELSHLSKENYNKFKDSYFSGGIWVLNLAKIREDSIEETMMDIIKDKNIIKRWNDQDVMNLACNNKVQYISLRYISYPYLEEVMSNKNFESHYTREELIESITNPKILHFAAQKPWNAYPKYWRLWMDIFERLNLPKSKIFKSMSLKNKIYLKIWTYLDSSLRRKGIIY